MLFALILNERGEQKLRCLLLVPCDEGTHLNCIYHHSGGEHLGQLFAEVNLMLEICFI